MWVCAYCETVNMDGAESCTCCGHQKTTGAVRAGGEIKSMGGSADHSKKKNLHIALAAIAAIVAVLIMCFFMPLDRAEPETSLEKPGLPEVDRIRNVVVICFDPVFDVAEGKKCHELMDWWSDPKRLAEQFISEMEEVSHGNARYRITEWIDLDEMPKTVIGQAYDIDEYYETLMAANEAEAGAYWNDGRWHDWGYSFDYDAYLTRYNVYERVNSGEIDDVWFFSGPMAGVTIDIFKVIGRGAYLYRAAGMEAECRPFAVYGFNYERGVEAMMDDAGIRAVAILSSEFGEPDYSKNYADFNDWERFTAYDMAKKDCAGVGLPNYAPNSEEIYDVGNTRDVLSSCSDWQNYPDMTDIRKTVTCAAWGNGDVLEHYRWWFSLLPHSDGINASSGKYNNWWVYFHVDHLS